MLWVNQGFLWPFSSSQTGSLPEGIHDFPWTHHVHPFVLRPWEVWSIPSGEINKFVTKLATHMAHTRISLANFNMSPTWNDSGKKKEVRSFSGSTCWISGSYPIFTYFHGGTWSHLTETDGPKVGLTRCQIPQAVPGTVPENANASAVKLKKLGWVKTCDTNTTIISCIVINYLSRNIFLHMSIKIHHFNMFNKHPWSFLYSYFAGHQFSWLSSSHRARKDLATWQVFRPLPYWWRFYRLWRVFFMRDLEDTLW